MIIKIYSNNVAGGYKPENFNKGLGGSEEALYIVAKGLAKNHHVSVFYPDSDDVDTAKYFDGVWWHPFKDYNHAEEHDVFISFKNRNIWKYDINAKKKIHWSIEVDPIFPSAQVDTFLSCTDFHAARNFWFESSKHKVLGLPVQDQYYRTQGSEKENAMLYCSSPDRGLIHLLNDWEEISKNHEGIKLKVAYGFDIFDRIMKGNPNSQSFKSHVFSLMRQENVEYLGWLDKSALDIEYQRCKYWSMPLNNPESELFCLNAVKAQLSGAIPVINRVGALQNTCKTWIDHDDFVKGGVKADNNPDLDFKDFQEDNIVEQWENLIKL